MFTSILCERLDIFSESVELSTEDQTGFRKGYCTVDNVLLLAFLCTFMISSEKKLYCAFIDFEQAYGMVWRLGLWTKLIIINNCVCGKCLRFIKSMYKGINSMISIGQDTSEFFMCNIGVRQGVNFSPFLFSLYITSLYKIV